jgi:hypothetical protein
MGSIPISFEQLSQKVAGLETTCENLQLTVSSLTEYISNQLPSKRDIDRLRQEIVLMKETASYAEADVGDVNIADLRAMLEVKPTLDNLIALVTAFDTWKTETTAEVAEISNQLRAMQIQLSNLARA